jgi:hypothetical protein
MSSGCCSPVPSQGLGRREGIPARVLGAHHPAWRNHPGRPTAYSAGTAHGLIRGGASPTPLYGLTFARSLRERPPPASPRQSAGHLPSTWGAVAATVDPPRYRRCHWHTRKPDKQSDEQQINRHPARRLSAQIFLYRGDPGCRGERRAFGRSGTPPYPLFNRQRTRRRRALGRMHR